VIKSRIFSIRGKSSSMLFIVDIELSIVFWRMALGLLRLDITSAMAPTMTALRRAPAIMRIPPVAAVEVFRGPTSPPTRNQTE
jgi:hypothetical protein